MLNTMQMLCNWLLYYIIYGTMTRKEKSVCVSTDTILFFPNIFDWLNPWM